MNSQPKFLEIKIEKLENHTRQHESGATECYLLFNSKPLYILNTNDPSSIACLEYDSPKSLVQLIFKKKNEQIPLGCISFLLECFDKLMNKSCSQWVTLFDDPEDDIFDGEVGVDDSDFPRAKIYFKASSGENLIFSSPVKGSSLQNDEAASPTFSGNKRENDSRGSNLFSNSLIEGQLKKVPVNSIRESPERLNEKNTFIYPIQEDDELLFSNLNTNTNDINQALEFEQQLNELKDKYEIAKTHIREKEELEADLAKKNKFLQEENERLKNENETLDNLVSDLELQVNETKIVLNEEMEFKKNVLREKEELINSFKDVLAKYETSKKEIDVLRQKLEFFKSEKEHEISMLDSKLDGGLKSEEKDKNKKLYKKNSIVEEKTLSENKRIKDSLNNDQIIQNLQKEIYFLKDENSRLKSQRLSDNSQHKNQENLHHNSNDILIKNLQNELGNKNKLIDEMNAQLHQLQALSTNREKQFKDLEYEESRTLKERVNLLESEKNKLKDELLKSNENYIRLSNKYVELTDLLASLQKSKKSGVDSNFSTKRESHARESKELFLVDQGPDEIDNAITKFFSVQKLTATNFVKIEKGIYNYFGRKIYIKLMNGILLIRMGGGYMEFQEFLNSNRISHQKRALTPNENLRHVDPDEENQGLRTVTPEPQENDFDPPLKPIRVRTSSTQNDKSYQSAKVTKKSSRIGKENSKDESSLSQSMISDYSTNLSENNRKMIHSDSKLGEKKNNISLCSYRSRESRDVSPILSYRKKHVL